ncbi:MAG: hypothetical protein ACYTGN_13595 [Planctomycetota bacterium]|jgi:hypothetical protein
MDEPLVTEKTVRVRDGEIAGHISWVYVWMRPQSGEVVYVGSTTLPPGARTWLHLHHHDPALGRIRAECPEALRGDITVRAFRLADGLDRKAVKAALVAVLDGADAAADEPTLRAAHAIAARLAGGSAA